jgi:hypothetical protein
MDKSVNDKIMIAKSKKFFIKLPILKGFSLNCRE